MRACVALMKSDAMVGIILFACHGHGHTHTHDTGKTSTGKMVVVTLIIWSFLAKNGVNGST